MVYDLCLIIRWLRSTCLGECADTTEREVPSGMMWLVLWILKASWCQRPNRTSWKQRSDTQRCCSRSVGGSLRRYCSNSCLCFLLSPPPSLVSLSFCLHFFYLLGHLSPIFSSPFARLSCIFLSFLELSPLVDVSPLVPSFLLLTPLIRFHLCLSWGRTLKPSLWFMTVRDSDWSTFGNLPLRLMERFVNNPHYNHLPTLYDSISSPLQSLPQILTMFEDNYPEGLKRVFLIKGTPAARHLLWLFFWIELYLWSWL